MENEKSIILTHNFDPKQFMWLFAKYAYGANPMQHCTNSIRGKYSKRFSRNNPDFGKTTTIIMDEFPDLEWDAIYICGVARRGYTKKLNYPHNVHIAILPEPGHEDTWQFEDWKMTVKNGRFEYVIPQDELDTRFSKYPDEYVTCRMFRWAMDHYKDQLPEELPDVTKKDKVR